MFRRTEEEQNEIGSNTAGTGSTFESVVEQRISRRSLLGGLVPLVVLSATELTTADEAMAQSTTGLTFQPVTLMKGDFINVPANHNVNLVVAWGDPIVPGGPQLNISAQNGATQKTQFGYNADFVGYFPLPNPSSTNSRMGLLTVNCEYTNPELMFPGYSAANTTKDQVDAEIAAHGIAIVEVQRTGETWEYNFFSPFNRRITGDTPMELTGPAAGNDLLKTSADPTGTRVLGTLNNCAGGKTPWGTMLSAEENFNQYFANRDQLPTGTVRTNHTRYGLAAAATERRWERFYDRFDVVKEPNEAHRFGWVVEVDPYDPNYVPKKRTALGRTKHEAATVVVNSDGRVVLYLGDDERGDYVYKFVTQGRYDAGNRQANFNLLDSGTLYVAKYNNDGSGEWIALIHGQNGLTEANGFRSQADICINTRLAGDRVGATKMDRPEDMEQNPVNGKVYLALTNNTNRGTAQPVDAANPRANNRNGHIIEMTEEGNDYASTRFRWEIFILAGNPQNPNEQRTYFAGFDASKVSPIACPDNIMFDKQGNMWIATDGQPGVLQQNDGLYAVATAGPERGLVKHFMSVPAGAECCGPELTPDNETLFIAIQHPGEGGIYGGTQVGTWPGGREPVRPGVVAITKKSGQPIIGTV